MAVDLHARALWRSAAQAAVSGWLRVRLQFQCGCGCRDCVCCVCSAHIVCSLMINRTNVKRSPGSVSKQGGVAQTRSTADKSTPVKLPRSACTIYQPRRSECDHNAFGGLSPPKATLAELFCRSDPLLQISKPLPILHRMHNGLPRLPARTCDAKQQHREPGRSGAVKQQPRVSRGSCKRLC